PAQGDTWATKASLPNAVTAAAGGAIGGKLYVVGWATGACGSDSDALEVYDPATDMWTSKAPLPEPRHAGGAGVIDGKFYVVGGSSNPCVDPGNSRLYMYDPATDLWTRKTDMPDRKSTRLNSSHVSISYAVFCLKKKIKIYTRKLIH